MTENKQYTTVNKAFITYYRTHRELMTLSERLLFDNIHNFVLSYIEDDGDDVDD